MSLGIVIKGPEGLVLAAESRVTLTAQLPNGQQVYVNYDNATKLLSVGGVNRFVGVVTYGLAAIGIRTAQSFMPEFEADLPQRRLTVAEFAERLSDFFATRWKEIMPPDYGDAPMTFVVAGYNEKEAYGRVYQFDIPSKTELVEQHKNSGEFGITWGGQREFVDRLLIGYDPRLPDIVSQALDLKPEQRERLREALAPIQMSIPLLAMPLQDCIDLAIFFVRTTIAAQQLTVGIRGAGGPIDVAVITREGLRFIQRKQLAGEKPTLGLAPNGGIDGSSVS